MVALVGVAPYLRYLTAVAFTSRLQDRFGSLGPSGIARAELVSAAFLVVVAALTGTLFARRYGLAGLGGRDAWRQAAPWLALAPIVGIACYVALGRNLALRVPELYPAQLGWALARQLKAMLFDEVVARFGMMTILCGIVRRPVVANVAQAAFFTLLAVGGLSFFGPRPPLGALLVASVAATFALHLGFGWLYARFGLGVCAAAHGLAAIEYPLHVLVRTW